MIKIETNVRLVLIILILAPTILVYAEPPSTIRTIYEDDHVIIRTYRSNIKANIGFTLGLNVPGRGWVTIWCPVQRSKLANINDVTTIVQNAFGLTVTVQQVEGDSVLFRLWYKEWYWSGYGEAIVSKGSLMASPDSQAPT